MAQLTVKELEALTLSDDGRRLPDGKSMFGRVRANRNAQTPVSVNFEWRYKYEGKAYSIRLGTWPKESLSNIRRHRDRYETELRSGTNPKERRATDKLKLEADAVEAHSIQLQRVADAAANNARLTIRKLFDQWASMALKHRSDAGKEARRAFEKDVFPHIGDIPAVEVRKAHIQAIMDQMSERNVIRMAKRVLSDLRQMFGFAIERDYLEADPTISIKKSKIGPEIERDRVLSNPEIVSLLRILPTSGLAMTSQLALLIQFSTLSRIGEVLQAKWESVDFADATWLIRKTKNGRPHQVHLSRFAIEHLQALQGITGDTPWLFPNSQKSGALDTKAVTKQVADRQRSGEPIKGRTQQTTSLVLPHGHWRPHDLRRTGASWMAENGISSEVIERCLNHTEQNRMKRIYHRASYETQIREAWDRWGEKLSDFHKATFAIS